MTKLFQHRNRITFLFTNIEFVFPVRIQLGQIVIQNYIT